MKNENMAQRAIFGQVAQENNAEEQARKKEIDGLLKKIDRKLKRYTQSDDELIGEPNYLVSPKELIPISLFQNDDGMNALGGMSSRRVLEELENIEREKGIRLSRYKRIRKAIENPECEGILNVYADESTTEDQDGEIIHVMHKNARVKESVEELFRRCDIYNTAWQTIWNMCGYGDEYFDVVPAMSGDRILKLQWIPREKVERVEKNGILVGFKETEEEDGNNLGGGGTMFATYKYVSTADDKDAAVKNAEGLIHPFRILHFRIPADKYAPYGKSILDVIISPLEQLNLMTKAMLIARVTRAPERRVFHIDVGNLQGEPAIKYAHDAVNFLKRKKQLDMIGGSPRQDLVRDSFGATEDIVIPKRAGTEGNSIDTLPQANNLGDISDVEFLRDRIFPPVGVPRQYLFDDQFTNANTNLSSKSVPFAKRIRRVQRFYLMQLYKLAAIELKISGYANNDIDGLTLMMNNPSNIDETERTTIDTAVWGLIATIKSSNAEAIFYPDYLIYRDYLRLDDDEIVELLKLAQLQAAGENIFKFMPEEDRPEGAKDLGNEVPNTGGAEGGGGGAPPLPGGGAIPPEAEEALGAAPEGGAEGETPAPENASIDTNMKPSTAYFEAMERKLQLMKKFQTMQEEVLNEVKESSELIIARKKTRLKNFGSAVLESSGELGGIPELKKTTYSD